MNDNRFIELVNLYIDRQITAAETTELEAEIQASPRRRAVYSQYCRMHRATKQVYESFRGHETEAGSAQPVGRPTIAKFDRGQGKRGLRWNVIAGGLAAAACVAFALIRMGSFANPAGSPLEVTVAKSTAAPALVPDKVVALAEPAEGLVSLRNKAAVEPDYAALVDTLRREDQRNAANGQAQGDRRVSLFNDGVFDVQPAVMLPPGQRSFGTGRAQPAQPAELTAFEFRR
jgi:anti-sigma factor RsiW